MTTKGDLLKWPQANWICLCMSCQKVDSDRFLTSGIQPYTAVNLATLTVSQALEQALYLPARR